MDITAIVSLNASGEIPEHPRIPANPRAASDTGDVETLCAHAIYRRMSGAAAGDPGTTLRITNFHSHPFETEQRAWL
jgi:hypothetical protein